MTCVTRVLVAFTMAVSTLEIHALAAPGITDDDPVSQVGFKNDVAPILVEKCIRCHGPDRAEDGFRVDDADLMADHLSGGDLEGSSLWTEYLAEDASNPMPPEDQNDPMSAEQLNTIRTWILAGAEMEVIDDWNTLRVDETVEAAEDVSSLLWILLGRMHPAALHFPIALLLVAALFAVLAFGNIHLDKAAMYCLFLGMLGSWVAAASGWGFAEFRGWSDDWTKDGADQFQHRWGGIAVAGLSTVVFVIAYFTRSTPHRSQLMWKVGVVIVAGLVGYVGHLGGKVHYGQDIYEKPLKKLQTILLDPPTPAPLQDSSETTIDKETPQLAEPGDTATKTIVSDQEQNATEREPELNVPPTGDGSDVKQETTDDGIQEGDGVISESVETTDDDGQGQ